MALAKMQAYEDLMVIYDEASTAIGDYGLNAVLKACDLQPGCAWTEVEPGIWARKTSAGKMCFDDTMDDIVSVIDSEIIQELEAEAVRFENLLAR